MENEKKVIYLVSDSTGVTISKVARAFLVQFVNVNIEKRKFTRITTKEKVDAVLKEALVERPLVISTIAQSDIRSYALKKFKENGIEIVDIFEYFTKKFENFLGQKAINKTGLLHRVSDEYFDKIKAIEYTVEHDDNRSSKNLDEADIILIGLSRTSKTPLSVYLAQEGYKVANFALVKGEKLPDALKKVDQKKIVGLKIDPMRLYEIRQQRAKKLGIKGGNYASLGKIYEEIEYAQDIFRKHPEWHIIDVTNRSVEESASDIIANIFGKKALD